MMSQKVAAGFVRLRNRRPFRRPIVWGGLAMAAGGVLFVLSSWLLPNVFERLGSRTIAQIGGAALGLLGFGIVCIAFVCNIYWIEFGERICVRYAISLRMIEWQEIEEIVLENKQTEIKPIEPLLQTLPSPGDVVAKLAGVDNLGRFRLTVRRICIKLKDNHLLRCDIRLPQWETLLELAQRQSIRSSVE